MWLPLALRYSIYILVYVPNAIYFFCVILCVIQGVPVSKGDNLRSDPNYLLIFALYSNCLPQKGNNFVILAISHIHQGSGFD